MPEPFRDERTHVVRVAPHKQRTQDKPFTKRDAWRILLGSLSHSLISLALRIALAERWEGVLLSALTKT